MSARALTVPLLACTGLLFALTAVPASAAPSLCPGNTEHVLVDDFNGLFEGPLWAPVPEDRLETADKNDDDLLCARILELPSTPPGLAIPEGEANVLVVFKDNPSGLR